MAGAQVFEPVEGAFDDRRRSSAQWPRLLVVLRPERLEDELGSLETERDVEAGRDELGHATDRRTSAQGLGKRIITWASVRE